MKNILIGWLAGRGVTLSSDASDQAVVAAVQTAATAEQGKITALGNEKSGLAARVTALENERNTEKSRADQNATALANEQSARKAERRGRAEMTTDLAIHRGILTIAERDGQVTALENSTDLAKDAETLLKKQPTHKTTTNDTTVSGKQGAALDNEQAQVQAQYNTAFQTELIAHGQDPIKAHAAVMHKPEYSALAAKLMPKKS